MCSTGFLQVLLRGLTTCDFWTENWFLLCYYILRKRSIERDFPRELISGVIGIAHKQDKRREKDIKNHCVFQYFITEILCWFVWNGREVILFYLAICHFPGKDSNEPINHHLHKWLFVMTDHFIMCEKCCKKVNGCPICTPNNLQKRVNQSGISVTMSLWNLDLPNVNSAKEIIHFWGFGAASRLRSEDRCSISWFEECKNSFYTLFTRDF